MAKLYPIKFDTSKETKSVVMSFDKDGIAEKEDKTAKDLEKLTLQNLFRFARGQTKTVDEGCLITDCLEQLKNLTDKEGCIKFTEGDIKFLKTGFSVAGPDLINSWFDNCPNLMRQIKDPKTEEELEKEVEKKKV